MDFQKLDNTIRENANDKTSDIVKLVKILYPSAKIRVNHRYYYGYYQGVKIIVNGKKLPLDHGEWYTTSKK